MDLGSLAVAFIDTLKLDNDRYLQLCLIRAQVSSNAMLPYWNAA